MTVRPRAASCPDRRPEVAAALDVHAGGRLVEDHQVRVGQQGHARTAAAAAGRRSTCRPAGRRCRRSRPASSTSSTGRRPAEERRRSAGPSRATVKSLSRPPVCMTAATRPSATASAGVPGRRPRPCPASGRARPSSMSIVVVLPAPFGPRKATTSPGLDPQVEPVDGGHRAEALPQAAQLDGRTSTGHTGDRAPVARSVPGPPVTSHP